MYEKQSGSRDTGTPASVFRLEGEYWTIVHAGSVCRLRDSAGLRYIAHLLAHPGASIAARDLVAVASSDRRDQPSSRRGPATDADELARVKVTRAIRAALRRIGTCSAPLIAHLKATIRTGGRCSYTPDPRLPTDWEL